MIIVTTVMVVVSWLVMNGDPMLTMLRLHFLMMTVVVAAVRHVMHQIEAVVVVVLVVMAMSMVATMLHRHVVIVMITVLLWVQVQVGPLPIVLISIVLFFVIVGEVLSQFVLVSVVLLVVMAAIVLDPARDLVGRMGQLVDVVLHVVLLLVGDAVLDAQLRDFLGTELLVDGLGRR